MHDPRLPVTVITGFLGAGKTTLLNRWVRDPALAHSAILINEFGDIGIDHHLVERLDDSTVLLDSGCLCCTLNGSLQQALWALFQRAQRREIPRLERVIIETSGLADPTPLVYSVLNDALLSQRFRGDGIITLVDSTQDPALQSGFEEWIRQIAVADLILLTKGDIAPAADRARLEDRVRLLNPFAKRRWAALGDIAPDNLLNLGVFDPRRKPAEVLAWLGECGEDTVGEQFPAHEHGHREATDHRHEHGHQYSNDHDHDHTHHHPQNETSSPRHTAGIDAFSLQFDQPFAWAGLMQCLDMLVNTSGQQILRIKGIVWLEGDDVPRVVHCVQHLRYPATPLPSREGLPRHSQWVFITRHYPRHYITEAFRIFTGQSPRGELPHA